MIRFKKYWKKASLAWTTAICMAAFCLSPVYSIGAYAAEDEVYEELLEESAYSEEDDLTIEESVAEEDIIEDETSEYIYESEEEILEDTEEDSEEGVLLMDSDDEASLSQFQEVSAGTLTFMTENGVTSLSLSGDAESGVAFESDTETGALSVTIGAAGEYTLNGDAENTTISVAKNLDKVNLIIQNLTINNENYCNKTAKDAPVISIGKGSVVVVKLAGENGLTGSSTYSEEPAAIIKAPSATLTFEGDGALTLTDAMSADMYFGSLDPTDGISAKAGTVSFASGTVNVAKVNGSAVKTKNGTINICGGTLNTSFTYDDAVKAKDGTVNISSGALNITDAYGDGIQAEDVNISGGDVNVSTVFDNAAIQYYTSGSSSTTANWITETNDKYKTERINVNTGDHAGIKAGTKASTRIYKDLQATDPDNATVTYSASGSLVISGGSINIDTTQAGLKANRINGYTACSNGQYIVGAPDDGLHSNNDIVISGGSITINASDDGITAAGDITITGSSTVVDIQNSFEGIEGANIVFGTTGVTSGPVVTIVSDDDGINAACKTDVTYTYDSSEDEDCNYTKTTTKGEGNSCSVLGGEVTIKIDSAVTKSRKLRNGSSENVKSVSYSSDGDGIDCNGTLSLEGGTTTVFGTAQGTANSPLDADKDFTLGENAILLATGSDSMGDSTPDIGSGYYIVYGSSGMGGGSGSGGPGEGGQQPGVGGQQPGGPGEGGPGGSSEASIAAGSAFKVVADGTTLINTILPYSASFLIYANPSLASSNTVTIGSTTTTLTRTQPGQASGGEEPGDDKPGDDKPGDDTPGDEETEKEESQTMDMVKGQIENIGAGTWTSSNSKVVTVVKSTGKLTAKNAGTATITGTSSEGVKKTYEIIVYEPVLTWNNSSKNLLVGENYVNALTLSVGTSSLPITWKSSDISVLTVSGDNFAKSSEESQTAASSSASVLARGTGKATVTATIGGTSYSVTLTVKDQALTVKISDESAITLAVLQSYTPKFSSGFSVKNATWSIDNTALNQDAKGVWTDEGGYVSITKAGKITALKVTETPLVLTATKNGKSVLLYVTIKAIPVKTDLYINIGQKTTLKHKYVTNKNVTGWTINDISESSGKLSLTNQQKAKVTIKGEKAGTVELICTCGEIKYVTYVHVEDPSIDLETASSVTGAKVLRTKSGVFNYTLSLEEGETYIISQPEVYQSITWKSSKASKATVDTTGLITAVSKGKTIISAKVNNKTVKITVSVK